MVGVLALLGRVADVQGPGPEIQGLLLLEMALEPHPPIDTSPASLVLAAFITDLHSESSLLFLLRARGERRTDSSMGLVGSSEDCPGLTQDRGEGTTYETLANPSNQATHTVVGRAGLLGKGRGVPSRGTGSVCLVLEQRV